MSFLVNLDILHDDPMNARGGPPSQEAIDRMSGSMQSIGQLQAITVRRADDSQENEPCERWFVTIGKTRVAAARSLGWTQIRAEELQSTLGENEIAAVSAAENMVRSGMHPVDTWRAVSVLIDKGISVEGAADTLGLSHRLARRLQVLANMAPEIVDALAQMPELPRQHDLAIIASAPVETQQNALAKATRKSGIDWQNLAAQCNRTRIFRKHAIFDIEAHADMFDEDLFAEPDDDDRFTTTDVKGFLMLQKEALEQKAKDSRGRILISSVDQHYSIVVPPGFTLTYEPVPKRFKKDDPRKVVMWVVPGGYEIGKVGERMAYPKQARQMPGASPAAPGEEPAKERAPITKATLAHLARIKDEAIRAAFDDFLRQSRSNPSMAMRTSAMTDILRIVLLLFAADNISVRDTVQMYGTRSYSHHVAGLLSDKDGKPVSDDPWLVCEAARNVIDRMLFCRYPDAKVHSGDAAEWIGSLLNAMDFVPRCDTEEVLKGIRGDELISIAREQGINDHGTASEVRKRMIGNMPGWKPVKFDAAVPVAMDDDDTEFENPEE